MFCPRCATQNELEQGYCRHCGQELAGLRLGLDGSASKSLEKLNAAEDRINGGSATLFVFTLIALVIATIAFLLNEPTLIIVAFVNSLLGSLIGLPLLYVGKAKLKRATRLLSKAQTQTSNSVLKTQREDNFLTSELNANSRRLVSQDSVTEHTTLDLRKG